MEPITLDFNTLFAAIESIGTLGVLACFVFWFMRGDIVPRKSYEEWTEAVIRRTVEGLLKELGVTKD